MATEAGSRPPERSAPDGGSVVGEDTDEPGAHHKHPTEAKYIQIAVFLAVITAIEVLVYYVEAIEDYLVAILLALSIIKFAMVVGYFMHLRFDSRLFRRLFVAGLALAIFCFGAVLTTFHVWTR